jgi:hypothetical protein
MKLLSLEIIQVDLKCGFINCAHCESILSLDIIQVDLNKNSPIL